MLSVGTIVTRSARQSGNRQTHTTLNVVFVAPEKKHLHVQLALKLQRNYFFLAQLALKLRWRLLIATNMDAGAEARFRSVVRVFHVDKEVFPGITN